MTDAGSKVPPIAGHEDAPARTSFMEEAVAGAAGLDIDEHVESWHAGSGEGLELSEYLGMSPEEYARWATDPSQLAAIVAARRTTPTPATPPAGRGSAAGGVATSPSAIPPRIVHALGQIVAHARANDPQGGRLYDIDRVRIGQLEYGDWRISVSRTRAPDQSQTPDQRQIAQLLPSLGRIVEASLANPFIMKGPIVCEGAIQTGAGPRRWRITVEDLDAKEAASSMAAGATKQ